MTSLKWIVLIFALVQGGWLAFDGARSNCRRLRHSQDWFARRELGPWSKIVSAPGFEPRSSFIKCVHVTLGLGCLAAMIAFGLRPVTGWWPRMFCALGSLWYLPVGTVLGAVEIALLLMPQIRNQS